MTDNILLGTRASNSPLASSRLGIKPGDCSLSISPINSKRSFRHCLKARQCQRKHLGQIASMLCHALLKVLPWRVALARQSSNTMSHSTAIPPASNSALPREAVEAKLLAFLKFASEKLAGLAPAYLAQVAHTAVSVGNISIDGRGKDRQVDGSSCPFSFIPFGLQKLSPETQPWDRRTFARQYIRQLLRKRLDIGLLIG